MFLITMNVAWIPMAIIIWLGTPFAWKDGSSLKNKTDDDIEQIYNSNMFDHYGGRIIFILCSLVVLTLFYCLIQWTSGEVLLVFPVIFIITAITDIALAGSRYMYYQDQEKKAKEGTGTAIALADVWRDASLEALIKKAHDDRNAHEQVKAEGLKKK